MTVPPAGFVAAPVVEVEIEGQTRHSAVTLDFESPAKLTITRISVTAARDQALVIQSDDPMMIADHSESQLILWSSTAPDTVTVTVGVGLVKISNAWRDGAVIQAWVGDAGIEMSETDTGVKLSCSDGHDDWNVDLEIEIAIEIETEVEAAAD